MEELLLGALLAGEELNVVDEQDVDVAELVAERGHLVVADGVDHLVGELFAGDVADGGVGLAALYVVADGVHEMGLAHADAAVEEERVVGLGGALGDGLGGGHGELVAAADDEGVELVARVELGGGVPVEAGLLGRGGGWAGWRAGAGAWGVEAMAWERGEAAVLADAGGVWVLLGGLEGDGVDLELEVIDRLLDEVGVLFSHFFELGRGDAHVQRSSGDVGEAGWLQPGFERLPVDLFLERSENANPVVEYGRCRGDK